MGGVRDVAPALTYGEVGATLGTLPPGCRHLDERRTVGHGRADFDRLAAQLLAWRLQRAAGLAVHPSTPTLDVGTQVRLAPGPGLVPGGGLLGRLVGGWQCRVVAVVAEPGRAGFAYGTLPGHPESGEELFLLTLEPRTGEVVLRIRAFSRPGTWWSRALDPLARAAQRRITRRYLRALE